MSYDELTARLLRKTEQQAAEIERLRADNLRLYELGKKRIQSRAAQRREIERLRAALRPFANAAAGFDSYNIKNPEEWFCYGGVQGSGETTGAITVGDLRRARAELEERT